MRAERYRTRGSSADLHLHCAGPIGWDGPDYNDNSDDALIGTATHEALAALVDGVEPDPTDVATKHGVEPDLVRAAYYNGKKIWATLAPYMRKPRSEVRIAGSTTMGTIDVLDANGDKMDETEITVLDWKLGLSGDEHPHQLRAYGLAAVDFYGIPPSGNVTLIEAHLLPATYNVEVVPALELEHFRQRLLKQHHRAGEQFSAGPWCKFCPRRIDCPIRDQYIQSAGAALVSVSQAGTVTRETLGLLWDRAAVLERAIREYRNAIRVEVDKGGPIDIGGGRQVTLQDEERMIFPDLAGVLDALGLEVNDVAKTSKTALAKAIKKAAPPRMGAKRWRESLDYLENLGLVETKKTQILKAVKR